MVVSIQHLAFATVVGLSLTLGSTSVLAQAQAPQPTDLVAKAKTFTVQRSELDEAFGRHEQELLNTGRMVRDDEREKVRSAILDRLIFLKLLTAKATPEDRTKGEANAKKAIQDVRTRAGTDSGFKRLLQRAGLDEPTFARLKQEEQIVLVVLDRLVKSQIQISDEAVAKYYNEEPGKFERPEMVKVAHVLLTTRDPVTGKDVPDEIKKAKRAKIEELLKRLQKGDDFAKIAKENSEDLGSRANGGEITLARGQTVVEFEAAAAALKAGELSGVVTSQFGYHIIKGIERKPASRLSLAETSKDIREFLIQKEFEKRIPEFTEQLKKEAGLEPLPVTAAGPAK